MPTTDERARDVRRVLLLTLTLNLVVAGLKLAYGTLTHALALRADGFHSLTDSSNNIVGLAGVWLASRPADAKHPYGHHKMEILAASAVGASLLLMAWEVLQGAFERLKSGGSAARIDLGTVFVLVLTLLVNIGVARYEARRGRELDSAFLLSDAAHTRSDVLVTVGVMLSTGLVYFFGYQWIDPVAALAVAVFILVAGVKVLSQNLDYLLDAAQVDEAVVRGIVCSVAGVASAHKVRTRGAPGAIHVDLHIQIAPHLDVVQAHQVTHWVIDAVKRGVPGVLDVVVHTEPARAGSVYPALPAEMLPGRAGQKPAPPE
jgi:cation diffusion facilitator family transporter